jgi:hypothetical protein
LHDLLQQAANVEVNDNVEPMPHVPDESVTATVRLTIQVMLFHGDQDGEMQRFQLTHGGI